VLFNYSDLGQIGFHPLQELQSQFLVYHFAAAESQRHLGLVSVLEETLEIAQLDLVITLFRPGTEFNFLDMDLLLLFLCRMVLFANFKKILPIIHDPANGRIALRSDFHQIKVRIQCLLLCFLYRDNPDLLTVGTDKPYLRGRYLLVYAMLFGSDIPFLLNSTGKASRLDGKPLDENTQG
jgi:hypothetical protein